jgi:hypothetical protein
MSLGCGLQVAKWRRLAPIYAQKASDFARAESKSRQWLTYVERQMAMHRREGTIFDPTRTPGTAPIELQTEQAWRQANEDTRMRDWYAWAAWFPGYIIPMEPKSSVVSVTSDL